MSGLKLLFLAILDEFNALIFTGLWNQNKDAKKYQNQPEREQQNAAYRAVAVPNCPTGIDPNQSAKNKWTKPEKIDLARFCLEVITLGIASGLAVVYYVQMKSSLEQMKANRRQADAAESQLGEMKREQALSERAWVFAFDGAVQGYMNTNTGEFFRINFKNTGKTPAFNVRAWMAMTGDTQIIPTNTLDSDPPQFSGILAPDAIGSVDTASHPMNPGGMEYLRNTDIGYFAYGTIRYADIFGTNHWSRFVYRVRLYPDLRFTAVGTGNTCDDAETNQGTK